MSPTRCADIWHIPALVLGHSPANRRPSARTQKFWLIAACILAPLAISEPALAQTFSTDGNTYPGGINVGNTGVPTTVTLDPGVQVFVTPNTSNFGVIVSTGTAAGTGNPATLIANNAAVTLTTTTSFSSALILHPTQGNATFTASGIINVVGGDKTLVIQTAP
ncbi:MAG TPA: hypothetical protein VFL55_18715, partial [Acetobacteraceae bacterium]|nr:hypothetical protein [Acetobacteraceae bacterium]